MLEIFNKSVKLTTNQREGAKLMLRAGLQLLDQANDDDETPLEITGYEVLEVVGSQLKARLGN